MWKTFPALFLLVPLALAGPPEDLAEPFPVLAEGRPIDVEVGHAAPCLFDFDRDGKPDLLVGQFGGGKLRIYLNRGTPAKPLFRDFQWFQAGGTTGKVPSG